MPGTGGKRRPGKYQLPQRQEAKGLSPERGAGSKGGRGINVKDSAVQPRSDRPQKSHVEYIVRLCLFKKKKKKKKKKKNN